MMKTLPKILYWILIGALALLFILWSLTKKQQKFLQIDSHHSITIEIADTPSKLKKGFMFRTHIPKAYGMLFQFPEEKPWAFWMKNTFIPLDIIWMNQHKQVIYYIDNVQPCLHNMCSLYAPPIDQKAKYVLELASGERERLHIQLNQKLDF